VPSRGRAYPAGANRTDIPDGGFDDTLITVPVCSADRRGGGPGNAAAALCAAAAIEGSGRPDERSDPGVAPQPSRQISLSSPALASASVAWW